VETGVAWSREWDNPLFADLRGGAMAKLEDELRGWLDRLAIQDLIYRYSDAVTRADWRQCEAVFAPDADLARISGEWKFTHRLFVPIYVGRGCVTGDLLTRRTALLRQGMT
jgi:SnoaL-like domain